MPTLLNNSKGLVGTSGTGTFFITLETAQPLLGRTPSTETGFTLVTGPAGLLVFTSTIGQVYFADSTITSARQNGILTITSVGTGTVNITGNSYFDGQRVTSNIANITEANLTKLNVLSTASFYGPVQYYNTVTYVTSQNTQYTDSIVELHVANTASIDTLWTYDDAKNIGFRFHYYKGIYPYGTGTRGALILNSVTEDLEWWSDVTTGTSFTGVTYGKFRTGSIHLTSSTNAVSTTTGAFTVTGGVGIGKDIYIGGNVKVLGTPSNYFAGPISIGTQSNNDQIHIKNSTAGIRLESTTTNYARFRTDSSGSVYLDANQSASAVPSIIAFTNKNVEVARFNSLNYLGINNTDPQYRLDVNGPTRFTSATLFTSNIDSNSTGSGAVIITGGLGVGSQLTANSLASNNITSLDGSSDIYVNRSSFQSGNFVLGNFTPLIVNNITDSTGTSNGSVVIKGGVGIAKKLYVGNLIYSQGNEVLTTATSLNFGVSTLSAGTDTAVSTSTGIITVWNTSTLQTITGRGNSTTNTISITNTASSTSTNTGALTVVGGVGVGGAINAKTIYEDLARVVSTATIKNYAVTTATAGTDTAIFVDSTVGNLTIWNTSTLQSVTGRGNSTTNAISITNTASSTSTNSGALTVVGGVGIGNSLYVGNYIAATNITSFPTNANLTIDPDGTGSVVFTTSTQVYVYNNVASTSTNSGALIVTGGIGVGGNIWARGLAISSTNTQIGNVYIGDSIAGTIDFGFNGGSDGAFYFTNISTLSNAATVFKSTSSSLLTINSTGTVIVNSNTSATSTNSGAFQVVGGAGIGLDLYVGGKIQSSGSNVITEATLANYGVTKINPGTGTAVSTSSGVVTIWSTASLQTVTDYGNSTTNIVIINTATNSTSTNSGALQVVGGVGIGGNIHAGGNIVMYNAALVQKLSAIAVGITSATIDTFSMSVYRSAKYVVSASNSFVNQYQSSEILVVHDGITPYLQSTSVFTGSDPIVTFYINTSTGNVILQAVGVYTTNTIKVHKMYIEI